MNGHFRIICSKTLYEITVKQLTALIDHFEGKILDAAAEEYWKAESFMEFRAHARITQLEIQNIKEAISHFFPIAPEDIAEYKNRDSVSLEHHSSLMEPDKILFILYIPLQEDTYESSCY